MCLAYLKPTLQGQESRMKAPAGDLAISQQEKTTGKSKGGMVQQGRIKDTGSEGPPESLLERRVELSNNPTKSFRYTG